MRKEWKRLLTLLVAAAMLFSMMPMGAVAQTEPQTEIHPTAPDTELEALEPVTGSTYDSVDPTGSATTEGIDTSNATELVEGTAANAVVAGDGNLTMFRFVPAESGTYVFMAMANEYGSREDTWAALYDADGVMLHADDDSGVNSSFMITYALTAGQVYYLGVRFYDQYHSGSFPVKAFRFHVADLSVEPVVLEDHVDGYMTDGWDEEQGYRRFYMYQWWDYTHFTVTMGDGTQIQGTGSCFVYQGTEFQLGWQDSQSPGNPMKVGATYQVQMSLGDASTEVSVTIAPCTIAYVAVSPVTMRENSGGRIEIAWDAEEQCDKEFYKYFWWDALEYTVTFVDGNTVECQGTSFYYNGKPYHLEYINPQSLVKPWTVGNTYNVEVQVGTIQLQVPVSITASLVASITASPIVLAAGTNGSWHGEWNPDTQSHENYYNYYWWNKLTCEVTLTDGTVIPVDGTWFIHNGERYEISCSDNQTLANAWEPGNTYTAQVSLDGASCDLSVTIDESVFAEIRMQPITLMENTYGGLTDAWDPVNETSVQYYRYWWWNELHYDVVLSDGTVLDDQYGSFFYYNGEEYHLMNHDTQEFPNVWTAGNTYEVSVSLDSLTVPVSVTIEGSPVAGIQARPVTLPANGGWTTTMYNPETGRYDRVGYIFDWVNYISYDVTMRDGTVLTDLHGSNFEYNGQSYSVERRDSQYESNWIPGNTYEAEMVVAGTSAPVTVSVAPSPIASVFLAPITLVENTCGGMTTDWNVATQQYETFYRYNWERYISYTVTDTNGNTQNGTGEGFWYNEQYCYFETPDTQSQEHWTVGNTYLATVFLFGTRYSVPVTIVESPIQSITVDPITIEENTNGYYSWDAQGKYFYYDQWYQNVSYTVLLKDGTTLRGAYGQPVCIEGQYYSLDNWWHNQEGQHWYTGNTYEAGVSIGGLDYPVYVTVCAATENNGFEYLVQNGQAIITGCTTETTLIQIPETINGYPVVGVTGLGNALLYAEEIRFPDSVKMLSESLFWGYNLPLKKLYLGSGVSSLNQYSIDELSQLEWIGVSTENPYYTGIDGAVYDKAVTKLLLYPKVLKNTLVVPDSVTDVESLFYMAYDRISGNPDIVLGAGIKDYQTVDGVIYNADMTEVMMVTASATGSYVMPDSVVNIRPYAFTGSKLTSVVISNNVTSITYGAFFNSPLLEEITIPTSVAYVEPDAFGSCGSLEKVHITDLAAWSQVMFYTQDANPLCYAHDLYLNGELVTDLVIPETLERDISQYAFAGSSIQSVTIPSNVLAIGHGAFADCTNLEKVYINDLAAWSSTIFGNETSNPLYYAHDLYLNGEKIVDLVLPETVANRAYPWECPIGVGKYAFLGGSFETVTVPSYVRTIGYGAFQDCENLSQVHVQDLTAWAKTEFNGLEANPLYVAHDLYLNGEKITDLVLPETVGQMVYAYAFAGGSMTSLTVPACVYQIGNYAFADSAVEEIFFAEGLDAIGFAAFTCSELQSLELPDSLSRIGDSAFESCVSLQSLELGSGLMEIPYRAFAETGIKSLTLPSQVNVVGEDAFRGSKLEEINIASQQVIIVYGAFANCPLEGDLELGENVIYIGGEAFSGNRATQVKLPATAVMLSYREFAFNDNLVSVTLPAEIGYIGQYAFQGSNNISHVLYTGTGEQWQQVERWSKEINNATLHVGASGNEVTTEQTCTTIRLYCDICQEWETIQKGRAEHIFEDGVCTVCGHDKAWEYTIDEEAGTVTVTDYAGSDTVVQMPETIEDLPVTAFTAEVFANDGKLIAVTLPETVTRIPEGAFRSCYQLEKVSCEGKLTGVGAFAFYDCARLVSVTLPDSITEIGEYAFCGCEWLSLRNLPKNLKVLGEGAFTACHSISIKTVPEGVTQIAYGTFAGCTNLWEITLGDQVTSIVYQAFDSCYNLTKVTIGKNVTEMDASAFRFCDSLEEVLFRGEKPEMAEAAVVDGVTVFYPATESWAGTERNKWYACAEPTITAQPQAVEAWLGDTAVLAVGAEGQRLRYQWYLAAPGSESYNAVGSNSMELSLELTEANNGSSVYCLVTDVLGQTAQTEVVTLSGQEKPVMQITVMPEKLDYLLGEELDNTGMVVTLTWADGTVETLESYELTGFRPDIAGEQVITVSYNGLTTTYKVTVTDPYSGECGENLTWKLDGDVLTISGTGAMKNYTTSNQPWKDYRGIITTVVVEEGVTSLGNNAFYYCRKITNYTLPVSLTQVGTKCLYKNEALTDVFYAGTAEQWGEVDVATGNDPLANATVHTTEVVTGIDIVFGPDKTTYWQGQELDLSGLEMNYLTSDGMIWPLLDGYTVTGYDADTIGEQTVTITYEGFTASFTVTVNANVIETVTVSKLPDKTVYVQGEALDTAGMELTVTWSNGTTEIVTQGFGIADYDSDILGEQTVSVYYRGNRATFTVTVEGAPVTLVSFYVHISPDKLEYVLGEELDLTGIVLMAQWSDGTTTQITEGYDVTGYDPNVLGRQSVDLCYQGEWTGFAVTVKAPVVEGTCGENLTWVLDNGTLTISGTGAMPEFEMEDQQPWWNYRDKIINVIIEDGVTSIGRMAFYSNASIQSVTIPESLSTVGEAAFHYTSSMTEFCVDEKNPYLSTDAYGFLFNKDKTTLICAAHNFAGHYVVPEGVMGIGADAFATCFNLTGISFPGTLQGIGKGAFSACWALTSVTLPENVTHIGQNAFSDCSGLTEITLPANLIAMDSCAFSYCTNLQTVTIPEKVTTIGVMAFIGCISLTEITLPESLTEIGTAAFMDCSSLTDVYYQGSAAQWGGIVIGSNNEPLTEANLHFAISGPNLTGIQVTAPTKTQYALGEGLDLTGMVVTGVYDDGTTQELTDYTVSDYEAWTPGVQTVTVCYGDYTTYFAVEVFHAYCVYGHTNHEGIECEEEIVLWTEWDISSGKLPTTPGNYRFPYGSNVTLAGQNYFSKTDGIVRIDLNGSTLVRSNTIRMLTITSGAECVIMDSVGGGVLECPASTVDNTSYLGYLANVSSGSLRMINVVAKASNPALKGTGSIISVGKNSTFVAENCSFFSEENSKGYALNVLNAANVQLRDCTVTGTVNIAADANVTLMGSMWIGEDYSGVGGITAHETAYIDCRDVTDGTMIYANSGSYQFASAADASYALKMGWIVPTAGKYPAVENTALTVKDIPTVTGITVTPPTKTEYWVTEGLNTEGMIVTASYSDGTAVELAEGYTLEGYDPYTAGVQTITVTYEDFTATFTVTVSEQPVPEPEFVRIQVTAPHKAVYQLDEELDLTGMVVTAYYSDGTYKEITEGYTVSGFVATLAGIQEVTVTYMGSTDIFFVEVKEPRYVTGIVVTPPEKTLYWVGEELDLTGLEVCYIFSDDSAAYTDQFTVSGYDPEMVGEQTITVTAGEFTDTFTVYVEEKLVNEKIGQVIIDDAKGTVGRTVDVKLSLQNNPGIVSMKLKIHFDSSVLTLTEVLDGGILGDNAHKPEMTNPYTLCWVNDLATENFTENGTLVTLRFAIAEDAPEGVYTIVATYDADSGDIMDKDLLDVEMEIIGGSVDVSKVLIGDVNGDGEINARDRAILTRFLADWEGYADQVDMLAADVNQDGEVNARDRAILTRYLADWDGYNQLPYNS